MILELSWNEGRISVRFFVEILSSERQTHRVHLTTGSCLSSLSVVGSIAAVTVLEHVRMLKRAIAIMAQLTLRDALAMSFHCLQ